MRFWWDGLGKVRGSEKRGTDNGEFGKSDTTITPKNQHGDDGHGVRARSGSSPFEMLRGWRALAICKGGKACKGRLAVTTISRTYFAGLGTKL
jgi:hypothetical protein